MYIVLLKFSGQKDRARELMAGHNAWLKRGFDEGVFVLAGTLQPPAGGVVLAGKVGRPELEERVKADPFVAEGVVAAEILEVAPSQADPRLDFLAR